MWEWLPLTALLAGFIGEVFQLIKIIQKQHYSGVSRFKYLVAISMSVLFTVYFFLLGSITIAVLYGIYVLIKVFIIFTCLWLRRKRKSKRKLRAKWISF
jgi:hypothetical protein